MADQAPAAGSAPQPAKKPSRRKAMDQTAVRRLRLQKAGVKPSPAPAQAPPPAPAAPVAPAKTVPLKPAQLTAPAPPGPAQAPPPPPVKDSDVLENLFTMALRRKEQVKPEHDTGMELVQAIAESVAQCKPITDLNSKMLPHIGEMGSKTHLMLAAMNYHSLFERGALYSLARWTLEKGLWNDLMNGQLSPVEKLALLQIAIKEMDKVESHLTTYKEDLDSSGRGTMADIASTAERAERSTKKEDTTATEELVGTSAVGREVTRRMLHKASEALAEKVKTTMPNAT